MLIFALVSMLCLPIAAQNRNNRQPAKPQQPAAPVETPAQRMFKSMLSSTAKIMFIDSVVVDKADFIKHVPLNKESGTLSTYEEHFKKPAQVPLAVFTNEFGDRCYYSEGDTLNIDRLPRHYREAMTLYTHLRSKPVMVYHNSVMEEDWKNLQELEAEYPDLTERKGRVEEHYRGTYWYYYEYE